MSGQDRVVKVTKFRKVLARGLSFILWVISCPLWLLMMINAGIAWAMSKSLEGVHRFYTYIALWAGLLRAYYSLAPGIDVARLSSTVWADAETQLEKARVEIFASKIKQYITKKEGGAQREEFPEEI